jgi:hypothetical protein
MTTTKSYVLSPMWRLYIAAWLSYMLVIALVMRPTPCWRAGSTHPSSGEPL